jgi:hypothetical protein
MLFAWFNQLVFHWEGSDAKGVKVNASDSDSGIEDAILQMDTLQLSDDDKVLHINDNFKGLAVLVFLNL